MPASKPSVFFPAQILASSFAATTVWSCLRLATLSPSAGVVRPAARVHSSAHAGAKRRRRGLSQNVQTRMRMAAPIRRPRSRDPRRRAVDRPLQPRTASFESRISHASRMAGTRSGASNSTHCLETAGSLHIITAALHFSRRPTCTSDARKKFSRVAMPCSRQFGNNILGVSRTVPHSAHYPALFTSTSQRKLRAMIRDAQVSSERSQKIQTHRLTSYMRSNKISTSHTNHARCVVSYVLKPSVALRKVVNISRQPGTYVWIDACSAAAVVRLVVGRFNHLDQAILTVIEFLSNTRRAALSVRAIIMMALRKDAASRGL